MGYLEEEDGVHVLRLELPPLLHRRRLLLEEGGGNEEGAGVEVGVVGLVA